MRSRANLTRKSTLANSLPRPLEELGSSRVVEMVPLEGGR